MPCMSRPSARWCRSSSAEKELFAEYRFRARDDVRRRRVKLADAPRDLISRHRGHEQLHALRFRAKLGIRNHLIECAREDRNAIGGNFARDHEWPAEALRSRQEVVDAPLGLVLREISAEGNGCIHSGN